MPASFANAASDLMRSGLSPAIIIADEPVSMLDDATARSIMRVFRRLAATQSVAVLLVTHNIHILRECCERVVVMHDGRFVEEALVALSLMILNMSILKLC